MFRIVTEWLTASFQNTTIYHQRSLLILCLRWQRWVLRAAASGDVQFGEAFSQQTNLNQVSIHPSVPLPHTIPPSLGADLRMNVAAEFLIAWQLCPPSSPGTTALKLNENMSSSFNLCNMFNVPLVQQTKYGHEICASLVSLYIHTTSQLCA